jgi:hypothetical protein
VSPYFRIGLVFAATLLAGCGQDTARTLGLTRDAPDEFQVTTRAPLSMPPSLGQLPLPPYWHMLRTGTVSIVPMYPLPTIPKLDWMQNHEHLRK